MNQRCPQTGRWFDDGAAKLLYNRITGADLSRMVFPVMIKGEDGHVYELLDVVEMYLKNQDEQHGKPFKLEDLEPVRYPGFKNYATTEELLKEITKGKWQPVTEDSPQAPTLDAGMQMEPPQWPGSFETNYRAYQQNKVISLMRNHMESEQRRTSPRIYPGMTSARHTALSKADIQLHPTNSTRNMAWIGAGGLLLTAGALGLAYRAMNSPRNKPNLPP